MTTTTRVVRAYGRIEAMAKAEEGARQTIEPAAKATGASKAATSKAERARNERFPDATQWIVTIEYDLNAAVRGEYGSWRTSAMNARGEGED